MPNEIINQVYELKRGKEDTLYQVNPVLMPSEPIIVFCNSGLTKLRIGDGFNDYRNLPFINDSIIEDNTLELISKINKTTVYLYDLSPGVYSFDKSVSNTFQLYLTEELTQTISSDYLMIVTGENGTFNPTTNFVKGLFLFKIDGNCCIYDIISGNSYFRGIKTGNSWRFIGEYSEADFYIPSNKGSDDESDTINNIANDRNTLQLVNNLKTLFDKKLNLKEDLQNKSKEIDEKSNDLTYPTTKAVQELLSITQTDYEESDINNPRYLINKPFHKTETEKVLDYTEIPCPKPDLFLDDDLGFATLDYTFPLNIGDNMTFKLTAGFNGGIEEVIAENVVVVDGSAFIGIKDSLTFALVDDTAEVTPYYISGVTSIEPDEESELGIRFIGKVDNEGNPIIDEESGLMVADENSSILMSLYDETGRLVDPKITIYGLESTVTETEVIFNQDYVESLQSDYNENDSTKPTYVKNRPVYEESKMFNYTRLEYDGSAKFIGNSGDFQVRSGRFGLEISNNKYSLNRVVLDPETGKVLESETYPAITLTLTSNTSDSGVVIPSGATVLCCVVSGYYIAFVYDGVVYNESTGTLSLGDGCIFKSISSPDTELRINGLHSEGRVTHKLPSRLVGCGMTYNGSSLSPQSGYGIQSAILSTIPEVPSSLGDGHIELVVTDDSEKSAGKKVSIYSKGIGYNNLLRTTSRDTIVNAVNEVYYKTVKNENNITKNASDISNLNNRVNNTNIQIIEIYEELSKNSADIYKVAKDLKGTANAVLNTVKGNQLEISDIVPFNHDLNVTVNFTKFSDNIIPYPYHSFNVNKYTWEYEVTEDAKVYVKRIGTGSSIFKAYLLKGSTINLDEGTYTIQLYTENSNSNLSVKMYVSYFNGNLKTTYTAAPGGHVQVSGGEGKYIDKISVEVDSESLSLTDISTTFFLSMQFGGAVSNYTPPVPNRMDRLEVQSKVGDEVVQSIVPDNSGVVSGLISQYPITSLSTNLPDNVEISCTYHQDVNVALSNLKNEMLGSMDEVIASIGGAQ